MPAYVDEKDAASATHAQRLKRPLREDADVSVWGSEMRSGEEGVSDCILFCRGPTKMQHMVVDVPLGHPRLWCPVLSCRAFLSFLSAGCVGCADEDGEWTGDAMDRKDLERSKQFPHLGAAFRTNVEQFGPNDFFVMQKCMKEVSGRVCSSSPYGRCSGDDDLVLCLMPVVHREYTLMWLRLHSGDKK